MTTPEQKKRERFFVEQAIRSLKVGWTILVEREPPDFLVKEGSQQFGLEVSDIFIGRQGAAGSEMKKGESKTQRMLDALRAEYEKAAPIPMHVKFVGRIEPETLAPVVQSLLDLDLAAKPPAFHTVIDTQLGLRAHVTKGFRSEWISVMDRVGWVDRNPQRIKRGVLHWRNYGGLQASTTCSSEIGMTGLPLDSTALYSDSDIIEKQLIVWEYAL
jgi:hypothetical protein